MLLLPTTRTPTPPSQASPAPTLTLRQSNFHGRVWPGAFTLMSKIPRHKSQSPHAMFYFSQDDSDSSDGLGS